MRVLLHDAKADLYYVSLDHWAVSKADAADLESIEEALRINAEQHLGATDVALVYDNPVCTLTLTV